MISYYTKIRNSKRLTLPEKRQCSDAAACAKFAPKQAACKSKAAFNAKYDHWRGKFKETIINITT